jgi:hypothetical protein
MLSQAIAAIRSFKLADSSKILAPGLTAPPFSPDVRDTITEAVKRIMAIESAVAKLLEPNDLPWGAVAVPFTTFLLISPARYFRSWIHV